jgi:hypothetical protein
VHQLGGSHRHVSYVGTRAGSGSSFATRSKLWQLTLRWNLLLPAMARQSTRTRALPICSYLWHAVAQRASAPCEVRSDYVHSLICKAMIYGKLGRQPDASAALTAVVAEAGDGAVYRSRFHSQWNEHTRLA